MQASPNLHVPESSQKLQRISFDSDDAVGSGEGCAGEALEGDVWENLQVSPFLQVPFRWK